MAIRGTELDLVLDELRPDLVDGWIQQVRVPGPDRLALSVRRPGRTVHALIVVQSVHARLHAIDSMPRGRTPALDAQAAMRQHVRGRIAAIERHADDRIVRVIMDHGCLLAELTGRHGNLFILDSDGLIIASLLANRSHRRDLRPGQPYVPPSTPPPASRTPRFEPPDVGGQMARHYSTLEQQERVDGHAGAALRHLRVIHKRLQRKADRQLGEADRQGAIDRLRREADLLGASRTTPPRGALFVDLPDLFDPEGPDVRVALDPTRTARQEIEQRYRLARRQERGQLVAAEQWERTTEELLRVEDLMARLEQAGTPEAVDTALDGAPRAWRPPAAPGRRGRPLPRPPYRAYVTPSGQRILVGRSGADNDTLTFRHARGRDIWLHVVGRSGAHVIIPLSGAGPDARVLEIAAQLALAHSGVDADAVEDVAWTCVKHVRRVKGAPPGTVTFSQERRLRLAWNRETLSQVELEQ